MTSCDNFRRQIGAYLDGEVASPERVALEAHLAECAACQARRSELAGADAFLAQAPEPQWSPGSTDALIGKLRRELAKDGTQAGARSARSSATVTPGQRVPAGVPEAHVIGGMRGWMSGWRGAAALAAVCAVILIPAMRLGQSTHSDYAKSEAMAPAAPAARTAGRGEPGGAAAADTVLAEARPAPAKAVGGASGTVGDREQVLASVNAKADASANGAPATAVPAAGAAPAAPVVLAAAQPAASQAAAISPVGAASPAPGAASVSLAALEAEVDAVDARLATVEKSVATFTTAARETATHESQMVASRRFAAWR